jgi:hypothetical protein
VFLIYLLCFLQVYIHVYYHNNFLLHWTFGLLTSKKKKGGGVCEVSAVSMRHKSSIYLIPSVFVSYVCARSSCLQIQAMLSPVLYSCERARACVCARANIKVIIIFM